MKSQKEQNWDNLYNEGEEGFNPYRQDDDGGEPLWSKVESRIAKIGRLLNGIGDSSFDADRKARLEAEQAELKEVYAKMDKPW